MALVDPLLGLVGSPLDVVTLAYLGWELRFGRLAALEDDVEAVEEDVERTQAATVATAEQLGAVDDDLVARDLDVDERDVEPLRTDGGRP